MSKKHDNNASAEVWKSGVCSVYCSIYVEESSLLLSLPYGKERQATKARTSYPNHNILNRIESLLFILELLLLIRYSFLKLLSLNILKLYFKLL